MEGIISAIGSSHAVAYGMKLAKQMDYGSILVNLSGCGDKDMDYIIENMEFDKPQLQNAISILAILQKR